MKAIRQIKPRMYHLILCTRATLWTASFPSTEKHRASLPPTYDRWHPSTPAGRTITTIERVATHLISSWILIPQLLLRLIYLRHGEERCFIVDDDRLRRCDVRIVETHDVLGGHQANHSTLFRFGDGRTNKHDDDCDASHGSGLQVNDCSWPRVFHVADTPDLRPGMAIERSTSGRGNLFPASFSPA